jgi:hypothetical protein
MRSPFSGKTHQATIRITREQYNRWKGGELIQNAMPHLSADEREFLMTGITPDEWDDVFKR